MSDQYTVILNGHSVTHFSATTALEAWGKVSKACEDGRSIVAELWRHSQYAWDETFYLGLLNLDGAISEGVIAIKGKCIITKQCIAVLDHP
jgi:hypothetical protein